ncbi:unnamed protein product [Calypogeia fissa]
MGGRGRGGYRGGNKRGRTQRRDFKDGRPNVWKKPRPEGEGPPSDGAAGSDRPGWETFVLDSSAFETYYRKQEILAPEEWSTFIETLRRPLPSSFRINGSGQFAQNIRDQMQHDFLDFFKDGIEVDGEQLEPIKPLAWYPDNLAWVLQASRMQLRKMPILERIHEFLKQENEIGSITRQEAVSMIPPLLLNVEPHHRVLDMCAAPGSKTFQLLEMIHKEDKPGLLPQGMVIANDLDVQRCHLLIHQTKRMCSPNILVTNHEGQQFPGLKEKGVQGKSQAQSSGKDITDDENGLMFDRILCDVPCSGDGTIRKAPDIWKKWHSGLGNGVHRLQIQIAMRGVALLRVGGRLVYSTCSLNPIEDEAVVGEILRQSEGCLELLDVSAEIPGLKFRPGLKSWKVRDKRKWLCSNSQVDRHRAGVIVPSMFPSGRGWDLSADYVSEKNSEENAQDENVEEENEEELIVGEVEVSDLPLERCMRILPHDQDTGGFFIAVFHKYSPFKVQQKPAGKDKATKYQHKKDKATSVSTEEGSGPSLVEELNVQQTQTDSLKLDGGAVEKTSAISDDVEATETLVADHNTPQDGDAAEMEIDGVEDELVESSNGKLQDLTQEGNESTKVSSEENGKRQQQQGRWKGVDPVLLLKDEEVFESLISYYGIKDSFPLRGSLVTRSEDVSRLKRIYYVSKSVRDVIELNTRIGGQLKITSAGLKIFERQAPKEGISPCAFRIASEGLPVLLPHMTKQIVYTTDKDFKLLLSSKAVPLSAFHEPEFAKALQDVLPGCCVVILPKRKDDGEVDFTTSIAVGCWRGRSNVSLLITKTEAVQFLQRLSLSEGDSKPALISDEVKQDVSDLNPDLDSLPQSENRDGTKVQAQSEQLDHDQNENQDS